MEKPHDKILSLRRLGPWCGLGISGAVAVSMNNERIADLFVERGLMDHAQAYDVLFETTQNGKTIEQAMIDHGIVREEQFYRAIADALGTEVIDLDTVEFTPQTLRLVPVGLARLYRA